MKFLIALLFTLNLSANEGTIHETAYNFVKINIGHGKPHLLELGSKTCPGCIVMGKVLYKTIKKHPTYLISYVNVSKDRSVATSLGISVIPTQIIYDAKGKEVYRHSGKLTQNELSELFLKYKF